MATAVRRDLAEREAEALNRRLRKPLDESEMEALTRFIHHGGSNYLHHIHHKLRAQGEYCPCRRGECRVIQELDRALRPKAKFVEARRVLDRVARRVA